MQHLRERGVKAWYPVRTIMGPIQNVNLHALDLQHELHVDDLIAAGDLEHELVLFRIAHIADVEASSVKWYRLSPADGEPH